MTYFAAIIRKTIKKYSILREEKCENAIDFFSITNIKISFILDKPLRKSNPSVSRAILYFYFEIRKFARVR